MYNVYIIFICHISFYCIYRHYMSQCQTTFQFIMLNMAIKLYYNYSCVKGRPVHLVAATLRPETMYGQTNCWVRPDMEYVAIVTTGNEVYVCTRRAALNMSYQGFTKQNGKLDILATLTGQVCGRECGGCLSSNGISRLYVPIATILLKI